MSSLSSSNDDTDTRSEDAQAQPESALSVFAVAPESLAFLTESPHAILDESSGAPAYHPLEERLHVFWHARAGLLVSPNMPYLPRFVPKLAWEDEPPRPSNPQILTDADVYLAFRPCLVYNRGNLFARLDLNRSALSNHITLVAGYQYALSPDVIARWSRLEDALIDVATTLIAALKSLPRFPLPKLPWEYGYRIPHKTSDLTLRCALRSRDAFADLATLVSFAIALHMDSTGPSRAFRVVQEKSKLKPTHAWFDLLQESYICNFDPNFRVGGFLNPYSSKWFDYIPKFTQAEVPLWIHWGHWRGMQDPVDDIARTYSPSDVQVESAQRRTEVTSSLVPAYLRAAPPPPPFSFQYEPPATSYHDVEMSEPRVPSPHQSHEFEAPVQDTPRSPSPYPASPLPFAERQALQQAAALVALQEHFGRMDAARATRLQAETSREQQQRESWEQYAQEHMRYTSKSAVYEWQEQADGTYRRVKLDSCDLDVWDNFTRNQRRFFGHLNVWELCPQLPLYSDEFTAETEPHSDDDDDDDMDSVGTPRAASPHTTTPSNVRAASPDSRDVLLNQPPPATNPAAYLSDIQNLAEREVDTLIEPSPYVAQFNFADFAKFRFGYDIFAPAGWTHTFEPSEKAAKVTFPQAAKALSFQTLPPNVDTAVIQLVKILSNPFRTFHDLPTPFDHDKVLRLPLDSASLQIILVLDGQFRRFLVCEKGYVNRIPWGILVSEATTVLFIFRHGWQHVVDIAKGLVARGVPFNTVAAADARPIILPVPPVRGLGTRPQGYKPTREDYLEYLRRRKNLLTGPKGRAALMHGGIVARIARDVVDPNIVLDGPSSDAVTIGRYQRFNLYDDALTDNDLNIICGVYFTDILPGAAPAVAENEEFKDGTKAHLSFWPKSSTWTATTAFICSEWTEGAELFYQKRKARIESSYEVLGASAWRKVLRIQNLLTKEIETGAEHYQGGYLEDFIRSKRFRAPCR